jgi:hypothetical protein
MQNLAAKRVVAAQAASLALRAARVRDKLAGCRTLGDAYRMGFRYGYTLGWQRARGRQERVA